MNNLPARVVIVPASTHPKVDQKKLLNVPSTYEMSIKVLLIEFNNINAKIPKIRMKNQNIATQIYQKAFIYIQCYSIFWFEQIPVDDSSMGARNNIRPAMDKLVI